MGEAGSPGERGDQGSKVDGLATGRAGQSRLGHHPPRAFSLPTAPGLDAQQEAQSLQTRPGAMGSPHMGVVELHMGDVGWSHMGAVGWPHMGVIWWPHMRAVGCPHTGAVGCPHRGGACSLDTGGELQAPSPTGALSCSWV